MSLAVENGEDRIEFSIPLHEDINSLIFHLRILADTLESIQSQEFPEGKVCKMTNNEKVEEISMKIIHEKYMSLSISIRKNWDFKLHEFEKVLSNLERRKQ